MNLSNKLIFLRDKYRFSQQYVADTIGVSKSTYCRYENGSSLPGLDEICSLIKLYRITYEEFVDIELPLVENISYPTKLLDRLEKVIKESEPVGDYVIDHNKYERIDQALEPILIIRNEAFNFPNIDLSEYVSGARLKMINMDVRGEHLIDEGLRAKNRLVKSMEKYFSKNIDGSK